MERHFPRLGELASMLQVLPELPRSQARLNKAQTIWDLRTIAQRRTPRGPFHYTDGSAEGEVGIRRARQAFEDVELHPTILRDVTDVDTSCEAFGGPSAYPLTIAPTGFTRLMHTEGETAGATAAAARGIPFALSTLGTTSIEDVRAASPKGRLWFQLYMMKERERSHDLVRRAAAAGYDTLLVTVDTPVAGARHRDKYNDMSFPPRLTVPTIANAIPRPEWWWNFLTTPPLEFASIQQWDGTVGELLDAMFDPSVDYDALATIRDLWPHKLVVKGIQSLADAHRVVDAGADGIILSNHGGRQLDRAPVPFRLLPEIARELGERTEIHVDTGVLSGADIVAAVAHGARSTMVGRAYLYGLMAGGRAGVDRALQILTNEIERTMRLLGVASLAELEPAHVTMLDRLHPASD
ncbi:MAG: alpha-hydroxy acid oxidase [Propionibacteriaceae bacterium]